MIRGKTTGLCRPRVNDDELGSSRSIRLEPLELLERLETNELHFCGSTSFTSLKIGVRSWYSGLARSKYFFPSSKRL
jgi:hypothetical protein